MYMFISSRIISTHYNFLFSTGSLLIWLNIIFYVGIFVQIKIFVLFCVNWRVSVTPCVLDIFYSSMPDLFLKKGPLSWPPLQILTETHQVVGKSLGFTARIFTFLEFNSIYSVLFLHSRNLKNKSELFIWRQRNLFSCDLAQHLLVNLAEGKYSLAPWELSVRKWIQLLTHCLLLTGLQAPLWLVWRQPTQEVMAFLLHITASGG